MLTQSDHKDWDIAELRMAVLHTIVYEREEKRKKGGLSGTFLFQFLNPELSKFIYSLYWLHDNDLIRIEHRIIYITELGREYFLKWGGDGYPPIEPSLIPRRPPPRSGGTSSALGEPISDHRSTDKI